MVRYVGWGAFAQAIFDESAYSRNAQIWREERRTLTDLLTADEWASARASTLNAHYTSDAVINGIWSAIRHLGFQGGRAIEPALGVGHFIGLTPEALREAIAWTGVEIDPTSTGIAKALYPGADIRLTPFESANWPDGFFDLAISNVPFGAYMVRDRRYSPMAIHDYFFVRGLDKVRVGGVVAFITSRYTLDKEAASVRKEIARRADFLGAIRLPGGDKGAFAGNAGTQVTADIIFLKRRAQLQAPGNEAWLSLAEVDTPDGPVTINRYFADNPQMMLGEMRRQGSMYSDAEPVLIGDVAGLAEKIAAAAAIGLPANSFAPRSALGASDAEPHIDTAIETHRSAALIKEGAFYFNAEDGAIYRRIEGVGIKQTLAKGDFGKLTRLIEIRDIVNALLERQARGDPDDRTELRDRLNRAYNAFYRQYGPINRTLISTSKRQRQDGSPITIRRMPNFSVFRDDPDAYKVAAIESYDQTRDEATKAAIFSHDIIQPATRPLIASASDALAVSLNETGRVDVGLIAAQLDVSEDEAIGQLGDRIWLDPAGEVWRTAEDYLSGDVVQKLEDAVAAVEAYEPYRRNVDALEAVQPPPLTRVDINVLCGAPWVPADIYKGFLAEKLNLDAGGLIMSEATKKWQFSARPAIPPSTQSQYGTSRATVTEIVLAALNNSEIRVMDPGPERDSPPIYNAQASEEANAKVAEIREAFSGSAETMGAGWIWEDDDRAARLEALYNQAFNRLIPTVYDGSHQTFPGLVRFVRNNEGDVMPFALRPHQRNAVWRAVSSGNTLLDHAVGAGKTFTMIAAGMEQKRLGLIQRPMFVVPNHMLEQFSREFLQAYPVAKLLVADKSAMARARRREFAARVAADSWDGVIITHDAFGRIRMSDAAYERFMRNEMDELQDFKRRAAEEEGKNSPTVKDLERAAKQLQGRLAKLLAKENKDEGVTFEELGVDFLFVDEAHLFKNLAFRTRHSRVKGLATAESQRATDLFLKIRFLEERRPGRTAVFATGTPISNTIAEMYTMQRYLQSGLLREYGIAEFDAWAATFGDIVSQVELAPNGRDYRTVRSFSRFVNIPELISLYSRVADTQTADMLNLPRPKLRNGQIQLVEAEMSDLEAEIMASLVARAEAIKGRKPEKGADNILKIMTEGLQLATDVRLLDADAPFNPDGKIAKAVENIHRIWKEGKEPALSQIVFLDSGVPGARAPKRSGAGELEDAGDALAIVPADPAEDGWDDEQTATPAYRFNLYAALRDRLAERGIPREEIAFIHDASSDEKKAQLFAAVRRGEIRVLIGSTGKMGVGTNVQERLAAMHHLDAPWRPADVEQRDGRILRQGNRNKEVEIYRYITRKTLDAYRWQILTTKAAFIAQIRAGARGVRTAGDIDSPLPEAAMIKAAATGDPRIMEHAELSKRVRQLEAGKRTYERSIAAAKAALERTTKGIGQLEAQIQAGRADAARLADLTGDAFTVTIRRGEESIALCDRKMAGERVKVAVTEQGTKVWERAIVMVTVGELSSLAMEVGLRRKEGSLQFVASLRGELSYSRGEWFAFTPETDAVGLIRRFESLLKGIPRFLDQLGEDLAKAQADLPRLERQIASPAFAKQAELDEAKARMLRLEADLQPQQKEQPNTMQRATPPCDARTIQTAKAFLANGNGWTVPQLEAQFGYAAEADYIALAIKQGREWEQGLSAHIAQQKTYVDQLTDDRAAYEPYLEGGTLSPIEQAKATLARLEDDLRDLKNDQEALTTSSNRHDIVKEQNMNNTISAADSRPQLARLETAHLQELITAGSDETAFGQAFDRLQSNLSMSEKELAGIAAAYGADTDGRTDRRSVLGAIEACFYSAARAATHTQQRANGRGR